jgi:hypothetical protein
VAETSEHQVLTNRLLANRRALVITLPTGVASQCLCQYENNNIVTHPRRSLSVC